MTTENDMKDDVETADGEETFSFVKDPSFKIDYKGDCAYEVSVSIPPENIDKKAEELFAELKDDAELPGFRRGKAPLKLLENKFGKAIRGEAAQKLVAASFEKLVKDEDMNPLDMPDVDGLEDLDEIKSDAPLEFTFKFEVAPKCTLGEYRGIEIERPVLEVGAKQVKDAIEQMRERLSTYEELKGNAKAKEGDLVNIDFTGTMDGEVFDGGTAENYPYIVGSNRFLKEFEEALVGVKPGQELTCKATFPEDYHHKPLAGKEAEFAIKVHEIKRKKLPDVNEDFAKDAGYDSLDEMKAKVKEHLQSGATEQSNRIAESRAITKVIESSTFEMPKSLIESSAQVYVEQEVRRLVQMRVPASKIEEGLDDIRKHALEEAERNIKALVVLNEIGKAEKIEVTEEDFEKEAHAIQGRTGMDMSVVQRFMAQKERFSEYESRIYRQKAGAMILDNAKITDKPVTQEELDKQDDDVSVESE